jgi:DNA polymerase III subunit beta
MASTKVIWLLVLGTQMPISETEVEKPAVQGAAMEITVSRQDLVRELTATQSVVERKTTIPILSNFLLEAEEDRLNITATDLDQAIRTSAAAKVKKPGSCTIPARKLYDYIKLLPDGDISIKLLENHWVQIRSGRSNTKIVGMARANYPQVPEFPSVAATSISLIALKTLIARTIFAISNEESRYTLNGALLVIKAESLAMVATDGHRLSFVEKPNENLEGISGEKRVLIPRKALQELQQLLSNTDVEKVEFADDEHTLFFRVGHRTLSTRKLSGQFPNFEAVMPRDNTKFAVVRCSELSAAIQRVAQFADERSGAIRMRLEGNELKISANSTESGESEDTIDTPYSSDPIVVGFNSVYILDFLKALGNEGEVRLEFKDSQSAGQMRPEDPDAEYKYRYVLMPMRI